MTGGRRGLRGMVRIARGEAGPGPAWALAAVATLSVFVALAGPRELTAVQASALRAVLAQPSAQDSLSATAGWQAGGAAMTPADMTQLSRHLAAAMQPPLRADPAGSWSGVLSPPELVADPAPQSVAGGPPTLVLAYRTMLGAYSRLVSGSLPAAVTYLPRHRAAGRPPSATTYQVAVTPAIAARFGMKVGSVLSLGRLPAAGTLRVRVTGILRPIRSSSTFWQANLALAEPVHPVAGFSEIWSAAVFIGASELTALQASFNGASLIGEWDLRPDYRGLTPAQLPAFLASINSLAASAPGTGTPASALFSGPLVIRSGVATELGPYLTQQGAASGIDSLLIADVFIAGLILMLVCAALAADAHWPELALLRARGGSARQVATRLLARTSSMTVPAIALGVALAVLALPAAASAGSWLLVGLAALTALAGPAAVAAWTHRKVRPADGKKAERAGMRSSGRRITAELTVVAAAGGALAAVRWRGVAAAGDPYLGATPVLVAAAAGLVAARLYPVPVGWLLRYASWRRGPVGFLGLAIAARSRLAATLPALTLVISLTLAAFATMVMTSARGSQEAASWQRVGADIRLQVPAGQEVGAAALRAIRAVPGVQGAAAVYGAASAGAFAAQLLAGERSAVPAGLVGLVVADPAQYAGLASHTPWPDFPAAALARRTAAAATVPVLLSSQVAAAVSGAGADGSWAIVLDGVRMPIRVAGTIGDTPARPAGGFYVVLPAWAAARLPALPAPDTVLAAGAAIDGQALRLAAARVLPGFHLISRVQVLRGLASSPASAVAGRFYRLGLLTTILFSVVAVLFSLAASARGRVQLINRMTALGMASRQARALAVIQVLPLLSVAVLGTLAGGLALAFGIGPAVNLAVFTGSGAQVSVRPDLAMLLPAAGIAAAAIVIVAAQSAAVLRRDIAAALRQEEAG